MKAHDVTLLYAKQALMLAKRQSKNKVIVTARFPVASMLQNQSRASVRWQSSYEEIWKIYELVAWTKRDLQLPTNS